MRIQELASILAEKVEASSMSLTALKEFSNMDNYGFNGAIDLLLSTGKYELKGQILAKKVEE